MPPSGAKMDPMGGKLHPPHYRQLHMTASSSDLLTYQQGTAVAAFLDGAGPNSQKHIFQENTYKKITPCDVCSQVLRGKLLPAIRWIDPVGFSFSIPRGDEMALSCFSLCPPPRHCLQLNLMIPQRGELYISPLPSPGIAFNYSAGLQIPAAQCVVRGRAEKKSSLSFES